MTEYSTAAPMGQCAVTGKMVPEDELVTIQGQRVCAEGKAILLQRLKAGEVVPGEMEKPPVLRRFGCIFLDNIILAVPFWILSFMFAVSSGPGIFARGFSRSGVLISLFSSVITVLYFGYLHAKSGQTVGKMAGKIQVVNMDGTPISTKTAYIRSLAFAGPSLLVSILSAMAVLVMGSVVFFGITMLGLLVGIYALANSLFALFDTTTQRTLHDRIAGTRVILK